jgi:hypothetical protein
MRNNFAPDSVGKINVTYQNAKRKKSKGSIKGFFFTWNIFYTNSLLEQIHLFLFCMHLISFILQIHCLYEFI